MKKGQSKIWPLLDPFSFICRFCRHVHYLRRYFIRDYWRVLDSCMILAYHIRPDFAKLSDISFIFCLGLSWQKPCILGGSKTC